MASAALEAEVQLAEQAVTKQGDIVRSLKALLKEGKGKKVGLYSHTLNSKQPCTCKSLSITLIGMLIKQKIIACKIDLKDCIKLI